MKKFVTVSRKWDNPNIEITISDDGIALYMTMDDFRQALKEEIKSVTWVFRKETFNKLLDKAIQRVINGIKDESIKVIARPR